MRPGRRSETRSDVIEEVRNLHWQEIDPVAVHLSLSEIPKRLRSWKLHLIRKLIDSPFGWLPMFLAAVLSLLKTSPLSSWRTSPSVTRSGFVSAQQRSAYG
jgi:hypothetical protein